MYKTLFVSLAALSASAAFAQPATTATPQGADPAGAPLDSSAAPTNSTGAAGAAQQDGSAGATAATGSADTATGQSAASNSSAQIAAVLDAGFPKYDANKDGKLTAAEFKQWVGDLKTQELARSGQPANAAAVNSYAATALKAADKNGDQLVTREEFTAFLGG